MFTLGRSIDFNYKTNKRIALLSLIVAAVGWMITKEVFSGLSIGMGTFLTWALSRELDPKYDYSAFLAAACSLLNIFYYENIQLLVIFWILLLMRLVNGITGKIRTTFDIFSILGFTTYLSLNNKNSIYLIIYILAMAFILKGSEKKLEIVLASVISLGVFIVESFFMNYLSFNSINNLNYISIVIIIVLFLSFIVFWFLSKEAVEDDLGNNVNRSTILSSQILYSTSVLFLLFFDSVSINNLVIYSSVVVGVTIYFIGNKVLD